MSTFVQDIQLLSPGKLIKLFELNATTIGGDIRRFHGYPQSGSIWWQGNEYVGWPCEMQNGGRIGSGQQPQPTFNIGNVDGSISALCLFFDDLVGATLIVHRTFDKYLDAVNFPGIGNPTANPAQEAPQQLWFINQKVNESPQSVSFMLTSPMDFNKQQLPGRQITATSCGWLGRGGYRGPNCGYTGAAMFDINGNPTTDATQDKCKGLLSDCKLRFGATNELPYGGFPAADLVRS